MNIQLREATWEDRHFLLELKNDPTSLSASINSQVVGLDEHEKWLKGVLANKNKHLYIAEVEGESVATVRADLIAPGRVELSWSVCPRWRGRGVAKKMVALTVKRSEHQVVARVKKENKASCAVAEFAGLHLKEELEDGLLVFGNF